MTILDRIVERKRERMRQLRQRRASLTEVLSKPGLSVIAEFKRRSPSRGVLSTQKDPLAQVHQYLEGGAQALSILTEEEEFSGSIEDFERVARMAPRNVALLAKDFFVDPLQLAQAAVSGATAVLLIVSALSQQELKNLLFISQELGLDVLVEVHNEEELERALELNAAIIGINNRDLHTFDVDIATSERLRRLVPPGVFTVAESGIRTPQDALRCSALGFDGVLIGEALMRAEDPAEFIAVVREGKAE